ncbi:MAG: MFS transporter [Nanoarchaeota archaeon]|nr:MFS transporter [Nanoarchaeota archaeon]
MPYKHLIHFALNKELSEIYLTSAIRAFALALVGVFIPAYLINLGYPVITIFYFYLYWAISFLALVPFVTKLYTKIGIKHSIFFSMPVFVIYFLMLYSLETYSWNLALIALVGALANTLYWPAFHINFIRSSDHDHRGEEMGTMDAFSYLVMILAPLIGGFVAAYFGFKILFGIVSLLLLAAPMPLFFSKEAYPPVTFSFRGIFHKDHLKNFSVFFVEGLINYTETVIWAVFVFISLKSIVSLGILTTLLVFCTTFFTFFLGRLSDMFSKRKLMRVGILSSSIIWFFKTMADSFLHFTILNSLFGVAFTFLSVPYMTLFYNKADKQRPAEFVVFREFALALGRVVIMLFVILSGSFVGSFVIAGFSSLIFALF